MDKLIIMSVVGMGGLGFLFASILAAANVKFKVQEDPKVEQLTGALPGVNCGACGLLSCHDYALKLAKDKDAEIDLCRPGGEETQAAIAVILGVEAKKRIIKKAIVHCQADETARKKKANYTGIKTCRGASIVKGGAYLCEYGCLGFGDCGSSCPVDAIVMEKGLPKILFDKCVACGKCVSACPRAIISLEEVEDRAKFVYVACSSQEKGPETRKACGVGCIACAICVKLSGGAFVMKNNLAIPEYEKIKTVENIGQVMLKCPTKVIKKISG